MGCPCPHVLWLATLYCVLQGRIANLCNIQRTFCAPLGWDSGGLWIRELAAFMSTLYKLESSERRNLN